MNSAKDGAREAAATLSIIDAIPGVPDILHQKIDEKKFREIADVVAKLGLVYGDDTAAMSSCLRDTYDAFLRKHGGNSPTLEQLQGALATAVDNGACNLAPAKGRSR